MNTQCFDTYASRLLPAAEQEARRQRMAQRYADAAKAMKLYAADHAAACKSGTERPSIRSYVVDTYADGPREMEATDYARSRFCELPEPKASRKRTTSPEAKARQIARERSRRRQ